MEYSPPQPPSRERAPDGIAGCSVVSSRRRSLAGRDRAARRGLPQGEPRRLRSRGGRPRPCRTHLRQPRPRRDRGAVWARGGRGPRGAGGWLAARPEVDGRRIAVRGSSMGGLLAIHAAAAATTSRRQWRSAPRPSGCWPRTCSACSTGAPPRGSALSEMRIDAPALAEWLDRTTSRMRPSGWAPSRCS